MSASRKPLVWASVVFLLSGCSALIFETVWFRIASVVLGSSVWSAAAVLMAFMSGLGLGNAAMAFWGANITRPFRFYVIIELLIASSGVASVYVLPLLTPLLAGALLNADQAVSVLNTARFAAAFFVFLLPAIAMGATLPVLQKAVHALDGSFSKSMGRLYGWNTIGAVFGVLLAEFVLIGNVGIKGSAFIACALNIIAALIVALWLGRHKIELALPAKAEAFFSAKIALLLVPPFIVGFALLALEVIWFRYILLTQMGTSIVFAMMLAIVLAGIGLGGLLVSRLTLSGRTLDRLLLLLPLVSCLSVVLGYMGYQYFVGHAVRYFFYNHYLFIVPALLLMLPTSIVSGMLFPLYGQRLFASLAINTQASGSLTLANTLGAALGSAFATFYLLPTLGVEDSLLALAAIYLVPSAVMLLIASELRKPLLLATPIAAIGLVVVLFPAGSLLTSYKKIGEFRFPGEELVATKEELNATLLYYKTDFLGEPLSFRLATNNYSMSASSLWSERYMKLYAFFPYIFKRDIEDVLLISYGVGITAEAVTELPSVKHIDVVDISKEIVAMSTITHSNREGTFPPDDERVTIHIEDGRFYLQSVNKPYDLITGEPPPPNMACIANLYSQEYFELMRSRLNPGGMVTYWLPVHDLHESDSLAITKAFCNAFDDCSMWNGGGQEFMLVGSNGGLNKLSQRKVHSAWLSGIGQQLKYIGLEKPGQLGALFMADSQMLQQLTAGVAPVNDNFPHRILPSYSGLKLFHPLYEQLLDINSRRNAFKVSDYLYSIFASDMMSASLPWFDLEGMLTHAQAPQYLQDNAFDWQAFVELLQTTDLVMAPTVWLGSDPARQRLFKRLPRQDSLEYQLEALRSLVVQRRYAEASDLALRIAGQTDGDQKTKAQEFYVVFGALSRNGLDDELSQALEHSTADAAFKEWVRQRWATSEG